MAEGESALGPPVLEVRGEMRDRGACPEAPRLSLEGAEGPVDATGRDPAVARKAESATDFIFQASFLGSINGLTHGP